MRRTALLLAGITLLPGCGSDPSAGPASTDLLPPAAIEGANAAVHRDLAKLRRVTAPFHDFDTAKHAGWSAPITPCMTDPAGAGGMGFHYGNTKLIDGTARVEEPELLLYEPEKHGRLRLVAVEYIIPYTEHSRSADPPELFGKKFKQNDTFQLWGLHAWVWKHNPSGMFADWNPEVTCEFATNAVVMSHH
jgi:hypothetical protein